MSARSSPVGGAQRLCIESGRARCSPGEGCELVERTIAHTREALIAAADEIDQPEREEPLVWRLLVEAVQPVHHREEREPRVPDDLVPLGAQLGQLRRGSMQTLHTILHRSEEHTSE